MSTIDFDKGYLQEKAMNALKGIVGVVETLNSARGFMPPNVFKELQATLWVPLHNSTKVVALLNGAIRKQEPSDIDLIINSGTRGLDRVLFKYGCAPEPQEMIRERERPNFARRVLQLSKGDRGISRTAIYDECQKFGGDELSDHIEILLEGVTQNTKEWGQFQLEVEHLLSRFCAEAGLDPITRYFGQSGR